MSGKRVVIFQPCYFDVFIHVFVLFVTPSTPPLRRDESVVAVKENTSKIQNHWGTPHMNVVTDSSTFQISMVTRTANSEAQKEKSQAKGQQRSWMDTLSAPPRAIARTAEEGEGASDCPERLPANSPLPSPFDACCAVGSTSGRHRQAGCSNLSQKWMWCYCFSSGPRSFRSTMEQEM